MYNLEERGKKESKHLSITQVWVGTGKNCLWQPFSSLATFLPPF